MNIDETSMINSIYKVSSSHSDKTSLPQRRSFQNISQRYEIRKNNEVMSNKLERIKKRKNLTFNAFEFDKLEVFKRSVNCNLFRIKQKEVKQENLNFLQRIRRM